MTQIDAFRITIDLGLPEGANECRLFDARNQEALAGFRGVPCRISCKVWQPPDVPYYRPLTATVWDPPPEETTVTEDGLEGLAKVPMYRPRFALYVRDPILSGFAELISSKTSSVTFG